MSPSYRYASGTVVPVGRSRDELEGLLDKVGADSMAVMRDSTAAAIAFRLTGRNYVLRLPYPSDEEIAGEYRRRPSAAQLQTLREQSIKERWRALVLLTKAKLVAVGAGITTPEKEFLAHAMLPTGQTLSEHLEQNPAALTTSGRLLLPGGES